MTVLSTITEKHIELFAQISVDLGRAKPTHKKVELLLRDNGWTNNNAVRASCDYMNWRNDKEPRP